MQPAGGLVRIRRPEQQRVLAMRVHLYDANTPSLVTGGSELLERWRPGGGTTIWVDLPAHASAESVATVQRHFRLHPLAVQDALRDRHPPKREDFDTCTLLVLRGLDDKTESLDFNTIQISLFVGCDFLITRTSGVSRSIERHWQYVAESPGRWLAATDFLALEITAGTVDRHLPLVLALDGRIAELEEILAGKVNDALLTELMQTKSVLKRFRRVFAYEEVMFSDLTTAPSAVFSPQRVHRITDIYEHLERLASLCSLYHDMISDLMDASISLASHRLNDIMRVLTIITAIFVPLSFLAGIYGMNFENMPELHSANGYFFLLATMMGIVVSLLWVFRRKHWL